MAIKLVNTEWAHCMNSYQHDYVVDTEADIADLPECCTGSSALVVESGAIYMVNASGVWAVFGG
ncbi:MAG: hypothetical protein J6V25_07985 [Oscillospiraceae bacterium]|nr:hypothetical protein [Oscillospiraceae bacterium]